MQSGAFSSREEVIERALALLSYEESWFAENDRSIEAKIQEGWEEAERGELLAGELVKAEMDCHPLSELYRRL